MQIVLLSGGSGKRLWPLSNEVRSKQFLKLFRNEQGERESMMERVYRQINSAIPGVHITVTTGHKQKSSVKNQLGGKVDLCVEPSRRDTYPAIALACAYLYSEKNIALDEIIVVCPVDPYVQSDYFKMLKQLGELTAKSNSDLLLMGVKPTYPSEKYGYIIPEKGVAIERKVLEFKEKPSVAKAEEYIVQGAMWNCGVFAFRLGYMMQILNRAIDYTGYADLYNKYDQLPKVSFDYAVVEKANRISCIQYDGGWKDVGTWNTLSEEMDCATIGNVIIGQECDNTNVINETQLPVVVVGIKNAIVSCSYDGILVSDKTASSTIKPLVDKIEQQIMYQEKSWGTMRVLAADEQSLTLQLTVNAGCSMSYHYHKERDEKWIILSGKGYAVMDGEELLLMTGSVVELPRSKAHKLFAETDMVLLEVQLGCWDDNFDKNRMSM